MHPSGLGHGIICLRHCGGSEDDSTRGVRTVSTGKATGKTFRQERLTIVSGNVKSLEEYRVSIIFIFKILQVFEKCFTSRRKQFNKFHEGYVLLKYLYILSYEISH